MHCHKALLPYFKAIDMDRQPLKEEACSSHFQNDLSGELYTSEEGIKGVIVDPAFQYQAKPRVTYSLSCNLLVC